MSQNSKATKRAEAEERAKSYTWANSKAFRKGTSTEAEWNAKRS